MLTYDLVFLLAISTVLIIALTKWYVLGRIITLPILTIDLMISIFLDQDLIRVIFDALALAGIASEIWAEHKTGIKRSITPNQKLVCGFILSVVGIFMAFYNTPLFLIPGVTVTIFALYELRIIKTSRVSRR